MPLVTNSITHIVSQVNYTFTNCAVGILNGNVVLKPVAITAVNASGLICSLMGNFPWWWTVFLISLYAITLFLFSYLNSIRLIVVSNSVLFVIATVLIGYSLIPATEWMGSVALLLISVAVMYMIHRG